MSVAITCIDIANALSFPGRDIDSLSGAILCIEIANALGFLGREIYSLSGAITSIEIANALGLLGKEILSLNGTITRIEVADFTASFRVLYQALPGMIGGYSFHIRITKLPFQDCAPEFLSVCFFWFVSS